MFSFRSMRTMQRLGLAASVALTPLLLIAAVLVAMNGTAQASSHREAPLISKDAFADNTDTYVWMSKDKNVVLAALWIPFEGPEGGPNYWEWDDTALYDIYVDNDGDAKADITYTLSSRATIATPGTFLYNTGPIGADGSNWNRRQYYTVTETLEDGSVNTLVSNKLAAPSNIGEKSTGNYSTLEQNAMTTTPQGVKIFAGQADDPFFVDLQVFDLLTLRGLDGVTPPKPGSLPLGYLNNNIPIDSLSAFNAHALVIEAAPSHVTKGDSVIGVWSGTRRPSLTVLAADGSSTTTYKQVSRLGMPLVNEVVLPMNLKDIFNSVSPDVDLTVYNLLQKSVEDPEIGTLLCQIYGMPLPEDTNNDCHTEYTTPASGRGDIFDIFLRGMKLARPFTITVADGSKVKLDAGFNVNRPQNPALPTFDGVVPAEMIRINTAISGTLCSPTPNRLGILGGDACGFPNGRRLTDDVVEIELLAVAGAAYPVLEGKDYTVPQAFFDILARGDGIDKNDIPLRDSFPYLAQAQSGQMHWHTNPYFNILLPWMMRE
ncbi:MAG: DUF4331 domain-containing protein [Caldilineaceae bacterium]